MDLDAKRRRVFLARDPRAYNGTTSDPNSVSGVYIVDARDPDDLELITFHERGPVVVRRIHSCLTAQLQADPTALQLHSRTSAFLPPGRPWFPRQTL